MDVNVDVAVHVVVASIGCGGGGCLHGCGDQSWIDAASDEVYTSHVVAASRTFHDDPY